MRYVLGILFLICGFASTTDAASKTHPRLILPVETAQPGDTILAGVELKMDRGWHTYWRNPGTGIATSIKWNLPPEISAGEIQWPVPEKLIFQGLLTYVYEQQIILLVPLKISADAKPGSINLSGVVSWLECQEQCIPGNGPVSAALSIGPERKSSSDAALIESAKSKLPQSGQNLGATAAWEKPTAPDTRPVVFEWTTTNAAADVDFYFYGSENFELDGKVEKLSAENGKVRLRKIIKKSGGPWPREIAGLLITTTADSRTGYEVSVPVSGGSESFVPASAAPTRPREALSGVKLFEMLGLAFLGGLILNIMPCVLPVIALKILGFVGQNRDDRTQVFKLGVIYSVGVIVSFLVLAGLVIGVQQAGGTATWGMQMQNPHFRLALTVLITLVALNLFGLFEVTLGGCAMGAAGDLASREGASGAFFNGVLATALATPCTAPFLAPAIGWAIAQPPTIIVAAFIAVGFGLAFPYLILSWQPQWLKFLPKPGGWMERFKIAMGFPMLATALWLFTLTAPSFGKQGAWGLAFFLVTLGLAAWVWGNFVQRGSKRRGLAVALALGFLIIGYAYGMEDQMNWRTPSKRSGAALRESAEGIDWQPWSAEAVEKARKDGHPVLVDFTADWCLTCQANKKSSIEISSVRKKLKDIDAVALLADNTDPDAAIAAELRRYDRAGVPLVLVYPKNAEAPAIVLPALLRPGIVLTALDQAAK